MLALTAADVSFREELLCPICLELFVDPVILRCGHNFCRQCVREYWQHRHLPAQCCPECRGEEQEEEQETGQHALRPNLVVQQLSEKARSLAGLYCEQHGHRLKLFCHTDLRLICLSCRDGAGHRNHEASPAKEAAQFYKEQLAVEITSITERSAAFTRLLSGEQDKVSAVKKSSDSLLSHIKEEFAQMHGFLREREESLTRELAERETSILSLIGGNLQKVQEGLISMDTQLTLLNKHQAQDNDIEFLKEVSWLRPEDIQMPSEVSADLPLGVFKGPLQYKVWKEMKDFISPVPASLTFDPSSAHHKLLVSEDLTCVRLTDTKQQLHTAERFNPCVNVLAAQGFSSGRHYWEVEVGSKTAWDLGVAMESIQRKGQITLSPLDGYWTIWLRNGDQYKALDWPAVPLAPSEKPRRVGVYLDYEGGQVSFYNADRLSHLYTFKDTFTERVFPYFSPYLSSCSGNAEGLTLCTLKL
ncbi:nuclear factor 7, ovary-like [Heptranchias perlo]|uniref:nuclear factor 7, ovary-like n=1 Tax=Heptranchias perlo TaxID=212740 RepID=UPI00355995DB